MRTPWTFASRRSGEAPAPTAAVYGNAPASEQVLDEVTFSRDGPVPCFVSREIEG